MSIWKARSDTYKTYFLSTFCRSIFTNACWIFGTSLFVKVSGSKGYSQLYFIASLFALAYYIFYAGRGHKDKVPYTIYKVVLVLAFFSSFGCFLEPLWAPLVPYNVPLLYAFVVSVMAVDLIGTTLGPIVLQASVNPAIFRKVYQKIVAADVVARIAAALLVWLLSAQHWLTFLYPVVWVMLATHYVLFGITVWRMRVAELRTTNVPEVKPSATESIQSAVSFMLANPLVRVAMIIMVWSTLTKFVVEYLIYQVADQTFGSARQVASFLSQTTVAIYALSLMLHHLITAKLTSRFQLSTLLAIQPINVLMLGAFALLLPPFWPLVGLMVTYNIIHRSIQLPMSRQCLVPVPRNQRGTIVSLISMVVSLATIMTTGIMAIFKNTLHLQDFLIILLVMGSAILFVITSLDSYYIRNLWSYFKESRSGNWDEQQAESLSSAALESEAAIEDVAPEYNTAVLHSNPILETYAFSFANDELESASQKHRQMLQSPDAERRVSGLKLCYASGFPWFGAVWAQAIEDGNEAVHKLGENAKSIDEMFGLMGGYSSVFRRRIKSLALDGLESGEDHMLALKSLLAAPRHDDAEALVATLTDNRYRDLRKELYLCIGDVGTPLTIESLVARMYGGSYDAAANVRSAIENLPFGKSDAKVRTTIEGHLATLKRDELPAQMQTFMHTLFLEEYRLSAQESDPNLVKSIEELQVLNDEERAILSDMHLSFLKRSESFAAWQALIG